MQVHVADFTEVVFKSVAYRLSGAHANFHFLQCRARGAKLSPLFPTQPLENTPVVAPRPHQGCFVNLPVLTRISLSLSPRVPPVSPQCFANAPRTNGRAPCAGAPTWYDEPSRRARAQRGPSVR